MKSQPRRCAALDWVFEPARLELLRRVGQDAARGSAPAKDPFEKEREWLVVRADARTEAELLEILERLCSGFAARDADGVVQLFASDSDVVIVTSEESLLRGPDEVRTFLHRLRLRGVVAGSRGDRIPGG